VKALSLVGARPNFMKVAPFLRQSGIEHILVHTGQHSSLEMSGQFFEELGIPEPDYNLEVAGTPGMQLGRVIEKLEAVLEEVQPDWVVLYGDVNAVCSGAIIASRGGYPVAHVEAGLRSGNWEMPEEQNRVIADRLSQRLFVVGRDEIVNLKMEGRHDKEISLVGNIMIDTLEHEREAASRLSVDGILGQKVGAYSMLTLHRPSNVDEERALRGILETLAWQDLGPIIFPIHPRTRKSLEMFGMMEWLKREDFILREGFSYREMLRLNMEAKMVITDSGGLQEECCVLGTPCVVLRWETERPITLTRNGGTCHLAGNNRDKMGKVIDMMLEEEMSPFIPELWDGKTAERIAGSLLS